MERGKTRSRQNPPTPRTGEQEKGSQVKASFHEEKKPSTAWKNKRQPKTGPNSRTGNIKPLPQNLHVRGVDIEGHRVLRCSSPAIPNAIAGLLLNLRDRTDCLPHAYFGWTEGNPIAYLLKFLAFGEGDTAHVCRVFGFSGNV